MTSEKSSTTYKCNFYIARKNEGLRRVYLDSLMTLCSSSVSMIIYDPGLIKIEGYTRDLIREYNLKKGEDPEKECKFVVVTPFELLGARKKHPIFTTAQAFEKLEVEGLFLNSLLDHECVHCDDLMYGISLRDGRTIDQSTAHFFQEDSLIRIMEIRAYNNQLKQARKNGNAPISYLSVLNLRLEFEIEGLRRIIPKNDFEQEIVSNPFGLLL